MDVRTLKSTQAVTTLSTGKVGMLGVAPEGAAARPAPSVLPDDEARCRVAGARVPRRQPSSFASASRRRRRWLMADLDSFGSARSPSSLSETSGLAMRRRMKSCSAAGSALKS